MPDLSEIFELKKRWDSADGDDFGKGFYSPCLEHAKFYRTETGFFRLKVLDRWGSALVPIAQKEDIKIEILSSPDLDFNVADILGETLTEEEKRNKLAVIGQNGVLAALGLSRDGTEDERRKFRQVLFTYLIAAKKIEIKLAMMNSEDLNDDLFHYKRGYFIFNDEEVIAHEGSGNLTNQGLGEQGNFLNVYKSTEESHHEDIAFIKNKVDTHWEEKNERVKILPLDKETLDIIKKSSEKNKKKFHKDLKDRITEKDKKKTQKIVITELNKPEIEIPKYINYKKGKWGYQGKAVDSWISNEYKGILAMATGSGKTITSMIALSHILKEHSPILVVISAAKIALINQWKKECENFGISPLVFKGNEQRREAKLWELGMSLEADSKKLGVVIMTDNILVKEATHDALRKLNVSKLHIGDEIHNLGRKSFIENPPEFFDFRLGLSATPDRQYDEEGTSELFKYFGNKKDAEVNLPIFEFGLKEALSAGVLVPYDYHIHDVYLNEYELEDFRDLTQRISNKIVMVSDPKSDESLQRLYEERRKILENAEEKILFMKNELAKHKESISHTLIFASAKGDVENEYRSDEKQINEVNKILRKQDIIFHQVTGDETGDNNLMKSIISDFEEGDMKVLTSMVVLDEGVDIPSIKQAYILSSSTVKREWVQRRGRVLRVCDGKEKAIIHDFLVLPSRDIDYIDLDKTERKIIKAELERIEEFAELSENKNQEPFEVINRLEDILYIQ